MSILHRLPSGQASYLLLDGAQFDSVERWLYQHLTSPNYTQLYQNTELANARDASPHLINISANGTKHLADQFGVGAAQNAWGIILTLFKNATIDQLLEHLRSLLYVKTPTSEKAIFRWYDPRVCKQLLEHSSTSELSELMGPIETITLCDHTANWHEFNNPEQTQRSKEILSLSNNQIIALNNAGDEVFIQRLIKHLRIYFEANFASLSDLEMQKLLSKWLSKSEQLGFEDQLSKTLFCNILVTLGDNCLDPKNTHTPDITELLLLKSPQTPNQRIKHAADLAAEYTAARDNNDQLPATGTES